MKNYLLSIIQHKMFYPLLTILLGTSIVFYTYTYHIKKLLTDTKSLERNIGAINEEHIKNDIKKLKVKKKEKQHAYTALLNSIKEYENKVYKDKYNVVVDVIGKLNSSSFNIYNYKLNDKYDNIKFKISGSYLNLIKFLDFLQTIKANIEINAYNIELIDEKMLIDLDIQIGTIKI